MDRYDLMLQLPEFYRTAPFAELQRVLGEMLRRAGEDVDFTLEQLWPQTASGWGLDLWEQAWGIRADPAQTDQARRERILAKVKSSGVPTLEVLRGVAQSFSPYPVELEEENGLYRFIIRYLGTAGEVADMAGLAAAINEIKPAHLVWEVKYRMICAVPVFSAGVCRTAERIILQQEE